VTRTEVREFVKAGAEALEKKVSFGSGRITELNSTRSNVYPFVWLESLSTDPILVNSVPFDGWNIKIHIAMKDAAGSSPEEYEAIVDKCDLIGQKLMLQYNTIIEGYATSTIDGISRVPFIHKQADDTSGIILSFTLNAPDLTSICDD
jgi:hypothetical protein